MNFEFAMPGHNKDYGCQIFLEEEKDDENNLQQPQKSAALMRRLRNLKPSKRLRKKFWKD